MKFNLFASVAGLALVLSCSSLQALACEGKAHAAAGEADKPSLTVAQAGAEKAILKVNGMSCSSCEKAITAQLKKLEGVQSVSFRKGKSSEGVRVAEVGYAKGAQVTTAALVQAVKKAGYSASLAQ